MNDEFREIESFLANKTVRDEVKRIKKAKLNSKSQTEINELDHRLDLIRMYTVNLIERIKDKDDFAFDDLMKIKDMRNFVHYYARHIREYRNSKFSKLDSVHEIKFQVFNHIVRNYRIYDEPHEVSLLIMSMRGWIRQNANKSLQITYMPKQDDYLEQVYLEDTIDDSEMLVRDLANRYLPKKEMSVFELRFFEQRGFEDIGEILNISKSAAHNRYERALSKLELVINKIGDDQ